MTSAYRPVGPWVLLLLGVGFAGAGVLFIWAALRVDYALGFLLAASGTCGLLLGLLAMLEYPEQVRQHRLERAPRLADLWIEDTLDRAASISHERDDERTAA